MLFLQKLSLILLILFFNFHCVITYLDSCTPIERCSDPVNKIPLRYANYNLTCDSPGCIFETYYVKDFDHYLEYYKF